MTTTQTKPLPFFLNGADLGPLKIRSRIKAGRRSQEQNDK